MPESSRLHHRLRFRQHRSVVNLLPRRRRRRTSSSSARVHSRSPFPRCSFFRVCVFERARVRKPCEETETERQRQREFQLLFFMSLLGCFFPGKKTIKARSNSSPSSLESLAFESESGADWTRREREVCSSLAFFFLFFAAACPLSLFLVLPHSFSLHIRNCLSVSLFIHYYY